MVMKDGKWVLMDQQMTCTDGCRVKPNVGQYDNGGRQKMSGDKKMKDSGKNNNRNFCTRYIARIFYYSSRGSYR